MCTGPTKIEYEARIVPGDDDDEWLHYAPTGRAKVTCACNAPELGEWLDRTDALRLLEAHRPKRP